ncbi:MAG: efflux RND transporter permease subunit [bacterium]|nr:efflux RND transporter permease subunit [bacterium]
MHISEVCVKRPITTLMFYTAVFMVGMISLSKLAVDLLPDLSYPKLTIWTSYSDVAPEEVENFITKPIESSLQTLKGKRKISSVSQEGISLVKIDFEWGTDMDFAMLLVREKIDAIAASFPEDADRPVIVQMDPSSQPIMSLSISGEDLVGLKEAATAIIKRRMEQIDGVALATVTGGFDREIHVDVDIDKLTTLGLSLNMVSRKIDQANRTQPGGYIRKGRFRYSLRSIGEFVEVAEIENVVVANQGGNLIYLRDIASVKDFFKEPNNVTRYNGDASVGIIIQKEAGSNTVGVSESIKEIIADLKVEMPDLDIAIAYDQAEFIENSINNVLQVLVYGGILAFLVLFLFLHDPRNPINIAIAIPISIIATFSLLYFTDVSLNIMSIGGLALGVGLLVDNSIVVLENIFRHRQEGKGLIEATILGAKEISMAVSASTFTTVSVFFPIIFVEGVAGQLFKAQSLTITFALLCSLIVSLTLLPMLASHLLHFEKKPVEKITPPSPAEAAKKEEKVKKERGWAFNMFAMILLPFRFLFVTVIYRYVIYYAFWKGIIYYALYRFLLKLVFGSIYFTIIGLIKYWMSLFGKILNAIFTPVFKYFDKYFNKFAVVYEKLLEVSLNNRGTTIAAAVVLLLFAGFAGVELDRELMPRVDQGQFEIEISMPVGTPLEMTDRAALQITGWLSDIPEVESIFSSSGIVQEKGIQSERTGSLNKSLILVKLNANSALSTEDIIQRIRDNESVLGGVELNFSTGETTLQQVLGTEESDIVINVKGEDFDLTKPMMDELMIKLADINGLEDIHSSYEEGKPEVRVGINRARTDRYGITVDDVARYIENSMKGNIATQFKDFDKKINILVRPDLQFRDNLEDLLDNYYTVGDAFIPIRELVDYSYTRGPNEIRREDQVRTIQVFANIHERSYKEVISEISSVVADINLPSSDYSIEVAGETQEMQRSFRSLLLALLISIALVYMILAAQFESLKQPFVIMFAVPLAMIGTAIMLYITGNSLNIMSAIGVIILVGIVVNDAIIKVDFINQSRLKGTPLREAIMEAGKKRLRPIIMTTVTTVLGLTPMALGIGQGTGMQVPMAIAVIGGLLSSTLLTLIVIPVIYSYIEGMK